MGSKTLLLSLCLITSSLLLLTQTAQAGTTTTIAVADNATYERAYPHQTFQSEYQFQLKPEVFNLTEAPTQAGANNSSIWRTDISAKLIGEGFGKIQQSTTYKLDIIFNSTWEARLIATYTKQGLSFAPTWAWRMEFTFLNNSIPQASCSSDNGIGGFLPWYGGWQTPNPHLSMDFDLHGRFASNPSVAFFFGDEVAGDKTCNIDGDLCLLGLFFCTGSGIQFPMTSLTSQPDVIISSNDGLLYTHDIIYTFDTVGGTTNSRDQFNQQNGQGCDQVFIFFGTCDIANALEFAIKLVFGLIGKFLQIFIEPIPFVGPLFKLLHTGIDSIGTAILTLLGFLFAANGQGIGLGDLIFIHFMYAACWGTIVAGLTGNPAHLFTIPYYFLKGLFLIFIGVIWLLFVWLPLQIGNLIDNAPGI